MSLMRVYSRQWNVTTLGPGRRYVLWVQGCNLRCDGCISPEAQPLDGGYEMSAHALAAEVRASKAEGVTLSGGEPFLQADALCEFIDAVQKTSDIGVICYTGQIYEHLQTKEDALQLLQRIDLLIDGPYVRTLDDGAPLRGSSNQRVIQLTDRYRGIENACGPSRTQQAYWEPGGIGYVGIPSTRSKHSQMIRKEISR